MFVFAGAVCKNKHTAFFGERLEEVIQAYRVIQTDPDQALYRMNVILIF